MKKMILTSFLLAGLFIATQALAQTETKGTDTKDAVKTGKVDVKENQETKNVTTGTGDTKAGQIDVKPTGTAQPSKEATTPEKTGVTKTEAVTKPPQEAQPAAKSEVRPETGKEGQPSSTKPSSQPDKKKGTVKKPRGKK